MGTASRTYTTPPVRTTKAEHVSDDLFPRYQGAHRAHQEHRAFCADCTDRCPEGARLWAAFERLQDAYLARLLGTR